MNKNYYFFLKGRIALYAFIKSLNLKKDSEVIMPAFTCVVVPNALLYLNLKPIYIDIDPVTLQYDINKLEKSITNNTKIIILQNSFGYPPYYSLFKKIKEKYPEIIFIEDAAHGFGVKVTNDDFVDAKFFSFQWSKMMTTGLGGVLEVNNKKYIKNLEETIKKDFKKPSFFTELILFMQNIFYTIFITDSNYVRIKKIFQFLYTRNLMIGSSSKEELNNQIPKKYKILYPKLLKFLYNLKLKNLNKNILKRKKHAKIYLNFLNDYYKNLKITENFGLLTFPILFKNKKIAEEKFLEKNINFGDWFISPLHPLKQEEIDKDFYNYKEYPVAENICKKILNLPTNCSIKNVKKIIEILKELKKEDQIEIWGNYK